MYFFYWIRRTVQPLSDGIGFMLKTLRNWKGNALASRFYFWIISCNCCISLNMKIYISRSLILLYQNRSDVMLWKNEQYNCIIFRIMWIIFFFFIKVTSMLHTRYVNYYEHILFYKLRRKNKLWFEFYFHFYVTGPESLTIFTQLHMENEGRK